MYAVRPLSVDTYYALLSGKILMKLVTNIHHVSWRGWQGV